MPGGDRTGPAGSGPMTGRGTGYCSRSNDFANPDRGARLGTGAGSGRGGWFRSLAGGHGRRCRYYSTGLPGWMQMQRLEKMQPGIDLPGSKEALKQWAQELRSKLEAINRQLDEME